MTQTQEAAGLLADFRTRRDEGLLDAERVERTARRAADLIFSCHRKRQEQGGILRDAVALLCEITADKNREVARAGVRILFPAVIERLNDSFDPDACQLYDRIFSQVIDFYRRLPHAQDLDEALLGFGLMNESDLLARKSSLSKEISKGRNHPQELAAIRKVLILSRVTIGADVAVTSVIIAKLRALLPGAEFVLLGSAKLRELFGGDPRVRIHEIRYERGGDVLSRLRSWIGLVEAVKAELKGLNADQSFLIDPDSRLTQLGLLPLVKDERNYFFFESRSYQGDDDGDTQSIGRLASCWANEVFGAGGETFPYVALPPEHRDFGRLAVEKLRRAGARRVTVVSFGVGGNQNKRVSEEFEIETVNRLIKDSTLILDKGATDDEREQINRVVAALRAAGHAVIEINESDHAGAISGDKIETEAITWDGSLGGFAGLIAASDRYVGYDSAGQHIAAALRIPTLTIFVNSISPVFAERWRPYGPGLIEIFEVERN